MNPRKYMAIQLQLISLSRQIKALDGLPEFVDVSADAVKRLKAHDPQSPEIVETADGTRLLSELAQAMIAVQAKVSVLNEFFHMHPPQVRQAPGPVG